MNEKITAPIRQSLSQIKEMREGGENMTVSDAPEAESLGADFWKSACVAIPSSNRADSEAGSSK